MTSRNNPQESTPKIKTKNNPQNMTTKKPPKNYRRIDHQYMTSKKLPPINDHKKISTKLLFHHRKMTFVKCLL